MKFRVAVMATLINLLVCTVMLFSYAAIARSTQNEEEGILHVAGLTIDVGNYEADRNGEKLSLTHKEDERLKL